MTLKLAIEKVLREAAPSPMHRTKITKKIREEGLWETSGKTPTHSVGNALSERIKKEGDNCPWKQEGRWGSGLYVWKDKTQNEASSIDDISYSGGYSIDDIRDEGCFLEESKLDQILECLRTKKNLILQGPPGTGKTWLARRLAFALIGERYSGRVRAVQFHPNLSYEDFVRGWRPAGDGQLTLVDGPFLEMVNDAVEGQVREQARTENEVKFLKAVFGEDPTNKYVLVIEEINRGNPAQIFGEMLTLLEADKRTPEQALELIYRRGEDELVFIPDNLYVIGTMNIADRSLALVDLALRRRFAFIDLEPVFGEPWRNWVHTQCGVDLDVLADIEGRIQSLNEEISADTGLGPQFRIGHSFVTPPPGTLINDGREWFRQIVETEIGPLLDEYWPDTRAESQQARQRLLEGF